MWTKEKYENYLKELEKLKDPKYLEFTKKVTNTNENMIGINIPILRKMAKEISKTNIESFINYYKGIYFEEKMILGFVIGYSNNLVIYDKYLILFSNEINNWSICDSVVSTLKKFNNNQEYFYPFIKELLKTENEFKVRFALVLLLRYYIEEKYLNEIIEICLNLKSDKYYINMAISWLLCECFIKYPNYTKKFINKKYLTKFVLNKTISKICDSHRVSNKEKESLKKRRF